MSSRRERTPQGQSNLASARFEATPRQPPRPSTSGPTSNDRGFAATSSRPSSQQFSTQQLQKTDTSDSYASLLQTMIARRKPGPNFIDDKEIMELKSRYNAFSRPQKSMKLPLRSVFLDPSVNNIPPCKTRTELMSRIKGSIHPHPSYDLDRDGYVSQEDYRIAKRFDINGRGLLDSEEREVCQKVLADEFFTRNADDLSILGPQYCNKTSKQNVDELLSTQSFEQAYEKLKGFQRTIKVVSSKKVSDCMRLPADNPLTEHNFFTDKFDATAWNDFDAIPRSASKFGLTDHGGSRKRLMFSRQQMLRGSASTQMEIARLQQPTLNSRRLKLITDIKVENS